MENPSERTTCDKPKQYIYGSFSSFVLTTIQQKHCPISVEGEVCKKAMEFHRTNVVTFHNIVIKLKQRRNDTAI